MTSRYSLLKQAETKVSFSEPEGSKTSKKKKNPLSGLEEGKVKAEEGDLIKDLLKQEDTLLENLFEEEDDEEEGLTANYATTEDIGLLHSMFEAKLLEQQKVAQQTAENMQQALESKLQALMDVLLNMQEQVEHFGRSTPRRVGSNTEHLSSLSLSRSLPK